MTHFFTTLTVIAVCEAGFAKQDAMDAGEALIFSTALHMCCEFTEDYVVGTFFSLACVVPILWLARSFVYKYLSIHL